ncbi:MAG: Gfo/Idh/MocA family oxidoreductase [Planctomycetes bacterium]|nr:Gfo/Idh/MocA family oxidoreductase [Planctomycetota bacterium]
MPKTLSTTRRQFVGGLAAAAALTVVPRHVLGGPGRLAPSEVLTRGTIGTGAQGMSHVLANAADRPAVQLAVCDVDKDRLARACRKAGPGCEGCADFRRVLDRPDIDVIHIAAPPHWHALIAIAAMQAGKDVLCEKPMTRFIREGRAAADAARRYGRIFMCNTFGRRAWQKLRKLAASGLLGAPLAVYVGPRTGFGFKVRTWCGRAHLAPEAVPPELDYDMWLGPAPRKPYHPHRVHTSFRGYWDYDGGGLADMGQHWLDPVQYFLGKDGAGPVEVEAAAPWPPHPDACGLWGRITLRYADGTAVTLASGEWGEPEPHNPAFIEGPQGKVFRDERGTLAADPPDLFDRLAGRPDPPELIGFAEAVRTRSRAGGEKPDAEEAHRSVTLLHLGNIAIRTGRKLRWDPAAEEFPGDAEANAFADVPMRAPWHL